MKKALFIVVIIVLASGLVFKGSILNLYYSFSDKEQIEFVQEKLLAISQKRFDNINRYIDSGSKLLSERILLAVSKNLQKIDLKSEKIIMVATVTDGENSSIIEILSFYDNNPEAKIHVQLVVEKKTGAMKIRNIFFNDAFFLNQINKLNDQVYF